MADYHTDPVQAPLGQLDLPTLCRDLVRHWWMILSAGLVGVMGAYLVLQLLFVPVYTSSATLIVSARGGSGAASDLSATNTMTETFSQVLDSSILKKKVQEQLGLDHLPGEITTQVIPDTNLLTVQVSTRHPREAYEVLRGVLDNYDQVTSYMMKNVVLRELDPPTVPTAPSNAPNQRSVLKNAFLAGAVLMALTLAALSYFRDTVKNQGDVAAKLDTRLYLTVYHEQKYKTLSSRLKKAKQSILITDPTSSFLFVETFKKLRTKLMYQAEKKQCRVLLVTSVAENEGKSTVAANVALALSQKMERVVLIDGDLRRPAQHKLLSKPVPPSGELSSFLEGKIPADNLLLRDRNSPLNLILNTKSCPNSTELVSGERMRGLIDAVRNMSDYVVVDTPPLTLMADAEALAEYADVALLVVRQDLSLARQINDAVDILESGHAQLLGCIFNDVRTGPFSGRSGGYSYGYGYGYGYGRYGKGYGAYDGNRQKSADR